jgi:hypothetical protein
VAHKALLLALVSLAALRGPSCGSETEGGGTNAPCTRASDCENGLTCLQGVCLSPDAGVPPVHPPDSGPDGNDHD